MDELIYTEDGMNIVMWGVSGTFDSPDLISMMNRTGMEWNGIT